jgi:hypothetical protein
MKSLIIGCMTLLCLGACYALRAQNRPLTVCEALDSSRDHQQVVIRGDVFTPRESGGLSEGLGGEPCKGWPRHYFTAPSVIPIFLSSMPGVALTEAQTAQNKAFRLRLIEVRTALRSAPYVVTLKGTLLRKAFPIIFRRSDGFYAGLGFGPNGEYSAVLVVQEILDEGYR